MIKFIKNNKIMTIAFICCIIFVALVYFIKLNFFPNESKALYGDRLDGIEEVEITSKEQNKIESSLKDKDEVKDVSCSTQGRILNTIITIKDDVELDSAKALAQTIIENLDEDQISYYDIQVFINKNNDDTRFPIIGYKHQDKDEFNWTKDR